MHSAHLGFHRPGKCTLSAGVIEMRSVELPREKERREEGEALDMVEMCLSKTQTCFFDFGP